MSVVKQFSDLGVPLNLKCCIMRSNVRSYHLVADIAKQYGAMPQFTVSLINSLDGDKCVSRYLQLPQDALELVLRDDRIPLYVKEQSKRPVEKPRCEAFCITPEGNLQLCCAFPSSLGNLRNETFFNILQNNKELNWWRNVTLDDFEQCGKYEYCDYCNLCPGVNFSETGNPLTPATTSCQIAQVRCELAEKLKLGNDPLNGKTVQECLSSIFKEIRQILSPIKNIKIKTQYGFGYVLKSF